MQRLLHKLLLTLPPEPAHHLALSGLQFAYKSGLQKRQDFTGIYNQPVEAMGLTFPNPLGLAAGMDKNGDYIDALGALGFGFIEVGTVTPRPQPGNPKPRLFRIPEKQAIINRMGFNNKGVEHLVENLKTRRYAGIIGANIGKNKETPNEYAIDDYLTCLRAVYPHTDYITVNISSPNTPGLRELQQEDELKNLLTRLKEEQMSLSEEHQHYRPIAVKIAPDLDHEAVLSLAHGIADSGMDAIIATNTTLSREVIKGCRHENETGGLSGRPVFEKSNEVLHLLSEKLRGKITLIGVGGINDRDSAKEKQAEGAALFQIYTGFVYQGPSLLGSILKEKPL